MPSVILIQLGECRFLDVNLCHSTSFGQDISCANVSSMYEATNIALSHKMELRCQLYWLTICNLGTHVLCALPSIVGHIREASKSNSPTSKIVKALNKGGTSRIWLRMLVSASLWLLVGCPPSSNLLALNKL